MADTKEEQQFEPQVTDEQVEQEEQTADEQFDPRAEKPEVDANPAVERAPTFPTQIDQSTRRSDADALSGHFVEVVDGEHQGRYGVYEYNALEDQETGYPLTVAVRTRDDANELLVVPYEHVRPARAGRR